MAPEYVDLAYLPEPDGDETEVRASLRVEADGWWGGWLIGPAEWLAIASSTEPFVKPAATRRAVGRVLRARVRSGIDRESGAPTAAPTRTDELRERKTTEAVADACREASGPCGIS
jgi:hypothetical protein